jgi:hypothetical protein
MSSPCEESEDGEIKLNCRLGSDAQIGEADECGSGGLSEQLEYRG